MNPRTQLVVGIAGGSGSGKTTFARSLVHQLPDGAAGIIDHDSYYRGLSAGPITDWDHPDALETSLLRQHLVDLKAGKDIDKPVYDFATHERVGASTVAPPQIVVVEGILVLADPELREQFDLSLFIDTPADIRLARRIARDVKERGRTLESTLSQYLQTVRPAYAEFVAPCVAHADLVVPGDRDFAKGLEQAVEAIRARMPGDTAERSTDHG